ncbi:hypothetical protein HER10_EVM0010725 [Colletotrichum scovillei]|uniref:uncharacterized protein n=1 Tax=Colletotrichum scovillei TaxID=1209932 RepID=UPI0015C2E7EB|nr:uncharacterized protein HER10_EVM0010725 [Colletotrichum scovillei]KAF4780276.1 hypothetical protein HER10_EVM0010725 [Colletotrichum scovillei]
MKHVSGPSLPSLSNIIWQSTSQPFNSWVGLSSLPTRLQTYWVGTSDGRCCKGQPISVWPMRRNDLQRRWWPRHSSSRALPQLDGMMQGPIDRNECQSDAYPARLSDQRPPICSAQFLQLSYAS